MAAAQSAEMAAPAMIARRRCLLAICGLAGTVASSKRGADGVGRFSTVADITGSA
jgi:hypothetical protein